MCIDKDNNEIIVNKNNMTYGYKCINRENSELGMIITLDRYIYNYGNIFDNSIEEICLSNNPVFEKPGKFEKKLNKTLNHYFTYNK